jgi:hypothetical protein
MNVRNGWLVVVSVLVALVPVRGKLCTQTAEGPPITKDGTDNASASVKQETPDNGGFFHRLFRAYADDWFGRAPESPEPPRRGYPAPLTSPPFPFSDWAYGGSPTIGAPDTNGGPLMTALDTSEHGKGWEKSGIKLYAWINGGFNVSASDKHYGNAPAAYYVQPNHPIRPGSILHRPPS